MSGLVDVFPLIALIWVIVGLIVLWRLAKRYSLGAVEGGAWEHELPAPPGQATVPWELEQVHRQLSMSGDNPPIIALLNQMVVASPLDSDLYCLGPRASRQLIEATVTELQRAIGMRNG
ncbi:MAG: hypothetical protein R2706_06665 [Acidimicrobiales bacterium]